MMRILWGRVGGIGECRVVLQPVAALSATSHLGIPGMRPRFDQIERVTKSAVVLFAHPVKV